MPLPDITTFDGENGSWAFEHYKNGSGVADTVLIVFLPKHDPAGCKAIHLAQTVQCEGFDKDGKRIAKRCGDVYKDPSDNKWFRHLEDDEVDDGDGHIVVIDHKPCEKDPFYNGRDAHDNHQQGDATQPKKTWISDTPIRDFDKKIDGLVKIVLTFRTCAICETTGKILGCICWTSEFTPAKPGKISLSNKAECAATEGFKKALKQFMKTHCGKEKENGELKSYCPDDKTFGDPLTDGMKEFLAGMAVPKRAGKPAETMMPAQLKVNRENAGGAARLSSPAAALELLCANPMYAALKFTWAGEQLKTTVSLVLSPIPVTAESIAPFLEDRPELANDFSSLKACQVSPRIMAAFGAVMLGNAGLLSVTEKKDVMVTVIVNNQRRSSCITAGIAPADLSNVIDTVKREADPETAAILNFLQLNMCGSRS